MDVGSFPKNILLKLSLKYMKKIGRQKGGGREWNRRALEERRMVFPQNKKYCV